MGLEVINTKCHRASRGWSQIQKGRNRFCHYTYFGRDFYYAGIIKEVNKHCDRPWNRWMAKLRGDYFNSPWALLSVLAAVLLLPLAIAQTVFSILSYVFN
ncbi:hypothetical protein I3843_01G116800 [Carya illinoinensis]|uniref:Uncharacterized protein n=1 Tax=Carya illinoinensis TaxID=32201 RepID=A0A8T1RLY7_CARIL|nr:hypothetical protein CIPAW_01G125900 [Carya illinoinensis]KAG6667794.1 hypothetical protein CIPAW_01G125900 [Carya illinoinensis]KAG6667795.1 hypothetical protein CIPAW_01G125900 [Carya illinoinensis]KAG6731321.1 hypothetical protein I3842_01G123900 [Carya illinoinensis]KAG6731322.1 hypothetical protein I3842_01G123900 [Carya illinoinensis]